MDEFPTIEQAEEFFTSLEKIAAMNDADKIEYINNAVESLANYALAGGDPSLDRSENINEGAGRLPGDLGGF